MLELNRDADISFVREAHPDVVVFATGSCVRPRRACLEPRSDGATPAVTDAVSLLRQSDPRARFVVVGGGRAGLGAAEWLVAQGASVVVLEEGEEPGAVVEAGTTRPLQMARLANEPELELRPGRAIHHICGTSVFIALPAAIGELLEEEIRDVSAIVYADCFSSESRLCNAYRAANPAAEICEIGDCAVPRSALEAILEGASLGRQI